MKAGQLIFWALFGVVLGFVLRGAFNMLSIHYLSASVDLLRPPTSPVTTPHSPMAVSRTSPPATDVRTAPLTVPATNATKQVQAVEAWSVRWTAHRDGGYGMLADDPKCQFFTSETEAKEFAESLRRAWELTRSTFKVGVGVKREEQP